MVSYPLDEKILVAVPGVPRKRIMLPLDEVNMSILESYQKDIYAPGGMYEVDEPVYREIMEYEYIHPNSSYFIMTAATFESVKDAIGLDPIASLGKIRKKNAGKATTRKRKTIEEALDDGEDE